MSNVSAGAVLTLVVPLSLLLVILGIWYVSHGRTLGRGRDWRGGAPDT